MKTCLTALAMMMALSVSANLGQNERVEINYGGQVFQGQNTLFLKKEVTKLYPRINFQNWDLKRVVLVAKSARGFGEAYLKVGRDESRIETIDGNRFDFNDPGNFDRIPFVASGPDNGVWQIHLKGRIKVKKVALILQKKAPRRVQVTRTCQVVFETVWGKDIRKFSGEATGPKGSGVAAQACKQAMNKCNRLKNEVPLTQCKVL
ncbi:MAG: hypothetical protein K9K67_06820 [Bacteriovoracaceae bacterium]|nr:hypothetical protein [Bacteriovoracaceae bacterium]